MMRNVWLSVALGLGLVGLGWSQSSEQAVRATEITDKVQRLDLMNQILPLLLSKEQLRELLPAIEKARENVRKAEREEFNELRKLEPKLDEALKKAEVREEVPRRELIQEARAVFRRLSTARMIIADGNTSLVFDAFMKVANAGQKKTAAGSLDPKLFNPNAKVEEMTDDQKIRLFVREILLHPFSYDLMRKLSI